MATSNVSDDVEAGEPWRRANLATAKGDSYIPLEEDIGRVGTGYKAEAKQEIVGKGLSVQPNSGWNAREMGEGVLKTVRVETSYSP